MKLRIGLASDHAGYALKEIIKKQLARDGHEVTDFGTRSAESCDLPDFAYPAALSVSEGKCDRAILVDGAGYPSAIIANKVWGVYAATCNELFSARLAREHSNANVLCLGGKLIGDGVALQIVDVFLTVDFLGGKYQGRVDKVKALEKRHLADPTMKPREVVTVQDVQQALLRKESLLINDKTIITPSALDLAKGR